MLLGECGDTWVVCSGAGEAVSNLVALCSLLRERHQPLLPENWWQDAKNNTNLHKGRFRLDIGKKCLYFQGGQTLEQAFWWDDWCPVQLDDALSSMLYFLVSPEEDRQLELDNICRCPPTELFWYMYVFACKQTIMNGVSTWNFLETCFTTSTIFYSHKYKTFWPLLTDLGSQCSEKNTQDTILLK